MPIICEREHDMPTGSIGSVDSTGNIFSIMPKKTKISAKESEKKDVVQISNTSKALAAVDSVLNLGSPDRLNISDLNPAEKEEFLKMLSELLKRGVIGYEVLDVNRRPEKHFIVNQICNHRLRGAKLYKNTSPKPLGHSQT